MNKILLSLLLSTVSFTAFSQSLNMTNQNSTLGITSTTTQDTLLNQDTISTNTTETSVTPTNNTGTQNTDVVNTTNTNPVPTEETNTAPEPPFSITNPGGERPFDITNPGGSRPFDITNPGGARPTTETAPTTNTTNTNNTTNTTNTTTTPTTPTSATSNITNPTTNTVNTNNTTAEAQTPELITDLRPAINPNFNIGDLIQLTVTPDNLVFPNGIRIPMNAASLLTPPSTNTSLVPLASGASYIPLTPIDLNERVFASTCWAFPASFPQNSLPKNWVLLTGSTAWRTGDTLDSSAVIPAWFCMILKASFSDTQAQVISSDELRGLYALPANLSEIINPPTNFSSTVLSLTNNTVYQVGNSFPPDDFIRARDCWTVGASIPTQAYINNWIAFGLVTLSGNLIGENNIELNEGVKVIDCSILSWAFKGMQ